MGVEGKPECVLATRNMAVAGIDEDCGEASPVVDTKRGSTADPGLASSACLLARHEVLHAAGSPGALIVVAFLLRTLLDAFWVAGVERAADGARVVHVERDSTWRTRATSSRS